MGQEYLRQVTTQQDINYLSNTLLFDDFKDTLFKWKTGGVGTPIVERIESDAFSNGACMSLKTGAVNAAANDTAYAQRYVSLRGLGKIEISTRINITTVALVTSLSFGGDLYDGVNRHAFFIKYLGADQKWYCMNSGGTYTAISDVAINLSGVGNWVLMRFTFDLTNKKLTAYQCGSQLLDPLSTLYYYAADASAPYWSPSFTLTQEGTTTAAEVKVDDFLIRQIA